MLRSLATLRTSQRRLLSTAIPPLIDGLSAPAERLASALEQLRSDTHNTVDVRVQSLGDEGAAELAEALLENRACRALILRNGDIGPVGAAFLAAALAKRSTNTLTLDLRGNPVGDDGVAAIADALPAAGVQQLDLWCTQSGDDGAAALARALKAAPALRSLVLGWNDVRDAGACALAAALASKTGESAVELLNLRANNVADEGLFCFSQMLKTPPARGLALRTLVLRDNAHSPEASKTIRMVAKSSARAGKTRTAVQILDKDGRDARFDSLGDEPIERYGVYLDKEKRNKPAGFDARGST